jgi:glutamate racemase
VSDARPIGVFDSGVGGLSIVRHLRRELPAEPILYLADTAWCPYGGRPQAEIRERSLAIARYLVARGAKALVVACNTASAAALEALRAELDVPVVGVEPAVKPAAAATRNRRIAVLATEATLAAERFDRLMHSYASDIEVVSLPGTGFVEMVEAGEVEGEAVRRRVAEVVEPLTRADVDTVVLGCTHYPFLGAAISDALGSGVTVIDTGPAIARQTAHVLDEHGLRADSDDREGWLRVLTTGDVERVRPVVERLLAIEPGAVGCDGVEHADV